jgi:hypothetical protein
MMMIYHDKQFVYSTLTHCLINTPMCSLTVNTIMLINIHGQIYNCFHSDKYITQIHVHTTTHVASIPCNTTCQHTTIVHKGKYITCAVFSGQVTGHHCTTSLYHVSICPPAVHDVWNSGLTLRMSRRARARVLMHTIQC